MVVPPREAAKECLWYYGDPRTGKSKEARVGNPDAYIKLANKWWDGYKNHQTVIIDDLGKDKGLALADHMK